MLAALTNLPMDGAVGVALVSMFVSFFDVLFGLLPQCETGETPDGAQP